MQASRIRLEVGDGEAEKTEWNEFNTTPRVAPGSGISGQTKLTRSENLLIQRVPRALDIDVRTTAIPAMSGATGTVAGAWFRLAVCRKWESWEASLYADRCDIQRRMQ
jgi:hypothetical protein